jgi:hypothetical protein
MSQPETNPTQCEVIPLAPMHTAELSTLAVYDRITDPMQAIKTLGAAIFKSGIFGVDKPEIGEVLAMQCLAERKSPLELARTYHFIEGKLAIKSDALLAKFQMGGGTVVWSTRTDTLVVATFTNKGSSAEITAAFEDYAKKGIIYGKDGKTLKDNWKKWPKQMLTARAISEGVRLVAPECAFITVEEMGGIESRVIEVVNDLESVIPEFQREAAVRVLRKVGHLTDTQGWADIPDSLAITLAHPKRSQAFAAAVKAEYEATI